MTDDQPYSVDALTARIRSLLEGGFSRIQVQGEITNCRPTAAGHIYFSLRGQDAVLTAVLFRSSAARLVRPPRDGDRVVCAGSIEVYPPHGKYQLNVTSVRFGGEGELLLKLDQLKRKLHAEGLFAAERKRPLPFLPRRIGLVTSPTGAAVQDVIRSVFARFPARILIAGAPVQGEGAHVQMIMAMRRLEAVDDVDVIVLARGGGSLEDLWEFNQEPLVRAIATCTKPVISAVGHEPDQMLTDFVADVRAPTPTAVGPLIVPELAALQGGLSEAARRLGLAMRGRLEKRRLRLIGLERRLQDPRRLLSMPTQRLVDRSGRLERAMRHGLERRRLRFAALVARLHKAHPMARTTERRAALAALEARLQRAMTTRLQRQSTRISALQRALVALSPVAVLGRGYAIVQRLPGRDVIRSRGDVGPGDRIAVRVATGAFEARVEENQ